MRLDVLISVRFGGGWRGGSFGRAEDQRRGEDEVAGWGFMKVFRVRECVNIMIFCDLFI